MADEKRPVAVDEAVLAFEAKQREQRAKVEERARVSGEFVIVNTMPDHSRWQTRDRSLGQQENSSEPPGLRMSPSGTGAHTTSSRVRDEAIRGYRRRSR